MPDDLHELFPDREIGRPDLGAVALATSAMFFDVPWTDDAGAQHAPVKLDTF